MLPLMGSYTSAILTGSVVDGASRAAAERLSQYAAEELRVSPEDIVKIQVDLIDLEADAGSAERLFKTLLSSGVRQLYVGDLSLYFRTTTEAYTVLHFLERAGFQIFREPQDASSLRDERKVREVVDIAIRLEKGYRQARLQTARERNTRSGGMHGGNPPYGALSGEAAILDQIKRDQAEGLGHTEIASRLNAEMVKPRKGQKWYPAVIANILGVRRDAKKRLVQRRSKTGA
jgi:hypothetical protein